MISAVVVTTHSSFLAALLVSYQNNRTLVPFAGICLNLTRGTYVQSRSNSTSLTLVAETLVLAKTHGYVEKIEHELEEELQRENTVPPNRILAKWRRNGETLLKNKYTLLTVALFCVTECALILGELILDLHKVKVVLEAQETDSRVFAERLFKQYPDVVYADEKIATIYEHILRSRIVWADNLDNSNKSEFLQGTIETDIRHIRSTYSEQIMYVISSDKKDSGTTDSNVTAEKTISNSNYEHHGSTHAHGHSLEENIAHAFHLASITILSVLVFETILKALCAGVAFFQRKLETFDLCIVMISFVVDLVCMQIMPRYKIQDFVFILAFLLPWRVIRVVNSLVVAVQDHEHFRLKLIYGRKKKIVNSLRESEIKLQLFRAQCNALKRLCFNEGVDESKIDQILMVEECVVNKAGKSKCKIKIDNSSVILLNDKSDFPRLSPRPSILSLVDKVGRRKSMQPPGAPVNDRELFLNTKDSSKKGILKSRARSNSESGRGTLSSPEDGPPRQNSFGDGGVYSGLSTPIIINRKSSLNSPLMATHVRNIINSLEEKVNQMNGNYNRRDGGRGSIDTDSIAEEVEGVCEGHIFGRRVDSIEEKTEGDVDCDSSGVSYISKRRASLQPQKCVDEDDYDLIRDRILIPAGNLIKAGMNQEIVNAPSTDDKANSVIDSNRRSHKIIPTTIQIDPPSIHSNYSLSSSTSSNSNCSNQISSIKWSRKDDDTTSATTKNSQIAIQATYVAPVSCNSCSVTLHSFEPQPVISTSLRNDMFIPSVEIFGQKPHEQTSPTVATNLRPKTLRTPSDIENQNNLTFSDSSDICESQSCGTSTRNTSVEETEDDFDKSDNILSFSNTSDALMSRTYHQPEVSLMHAVVGVSYQTENAKIFPAIKDNNGSDGNSSKSSLNSVDDQAYPRAIGSSVDPPDCDLKCGSLPYLLS